GDTRIRFSIQYYLVALLFLLFDVETLLVVPWAVVVADKPESFAPAVVFVAILFVGIGWAWRVGGIEWLKPTPSGEVT
ncbi:MAG: NADH-quinone oxidoreductase subunit A, partial [Halobacteriota archaeon]